MEYQIEKNVPMPVMGYREKYPFNDMEPGDSFVIDAKQAAKVRNAIYSRKNRAAGQEDWTVRKVSDEQYRVWRIA